MSDTQMIELLTVDELAGRLRVEPSTIRRWVKLGALQAISLPHTGKRQVYRFRKQDLVARPRKPGSRYRLITSSAI
jgi:excisionase family DNA binding protein